MTSPSTFKTEQSSLDEAEAEMAAGYCHTQPSATAVDKVMAPSHDAIFIPVQSSQCTTASPHQPWAITTEVFSGSDTPQTGQPLPLPTCAPSTAPAPGAQLLQSLEQSYDVIPQVNTVITLIRRLLNSL